MPQGLDLTGDKRLRRTLDELGPKVERKVARRALNRASRPVWRAAKTKARSVTPGYARSMVRKVVTRRSTIMAIIGSKSVIVPSAHVTDWGTSVDVNYANIAHLIEEGTEQRTTRPGRRTGAMPKTPVLRPAFEENVAKAQSILADDLRAGIEEQVAKLKGQG